MISAKALLRREIERRRRFVQQPERTICDKKPRQARRAVAGPPRGGDGKVDDMGEAEARQRSAAASIAGAAPAASRPRRREFSPAVSDSFQRIGMAEIMRLLANALSTSPPSSANSPAATRAGRQSREQARLAGAVRSGDGSASPAADCKDRSRKQPPAAALDSDIGADQAHQVPLRRRLSARP